MKPQLLKLTAILLVLVGNIACDENEKSYPIDVSFTEYSLTGTLYQWTNLDYEDDENEVIIINDNETLRSYISCVICMECNCMEGGYPEVDFSKHSLLLTKGITPNGISNITKNIQQLSEKEFRIKIEIQLGDAAIMKNWVVAVLINKVSSQSVFTVDKTEHR